jgi:DNA-binding response OmpR family regulator
MPDYTILLIDYEPRSISKLTALFEQAGYRVEVARDGFAGIDAFEKLQPDLTFVEAMLPRKHGFEVCQALKRRPHGKNSLVFIITAVYKGRRYRWQARHEFGCDEYIEKPIDDERLLETVRTCLARRAEELTAEGGAEKPADRPDQDLPKTDAADV